MTIIPIVLTFILLLGFDSNLKGDTHRTDLITKGETRMNPMFW